MRVIEPLSMTPIGFVRTPFPDRVSAPRQPHASEGAEGTIELVPGRDFEHALSDLEGWAISIRLSPCRLFGRGNGGQH